MIGALLAVAANRLETGYALAQLVLLLTAFSASYLIVRGVAWPKLLPLIVFPAPILLFALAILESGIIDLSLPWIEAIQHLCSDNCGLDRWGLTKNQAAVSDQCGREDCSSWFC